MEDRRTGARQGLAVISTKGKHRDHYRILCDILEVIKAHEPAKYTVVMRLANLTADQTNAALEELEKAELITSEAHKTIKTTRYTYGITAKGKDFLAQSATLGRMLSTRN